MSPLVRKTVLKSGLILFGILICLTFFNLFLSSKGRISQRDLTFYLGTEVPELSFDPSHGNFISNAAVTHQIIGTLVHFSSDGLFVPLAAESWTISPSGLVYNFKIRAGMFDQLGNSLDAEYFLNGLHLLLLSEAAKRDPPDFSLLKGWNDFREKRVQKIEGLKVISALEFQMIFEEKPTSILKFLSTPKFGFVYTGDFEGGRWRDPTKVTSTSYYKLSKISDDRRDIELELNQENLQHLPQNAPRTVRIKRANLPAQNENLTKSIALFRSAEAVRTHPSGTLLIGPPVMLAFVAISPFLPPLSDFRFRQKLYLCLKLIHQKNWSRSKIPAATYTFGFYPSVSDENSVMIEKCNDFQLVDTLRVSFPAQVVMKEREYIEELLGAVIPRNKLVFETEDRSKPNWLAELQGYRKYHIRIGGVSTGAQYINWGVKMMFCGNLGVGLPDPSGTICRNVQKVEDKILGTEKAKRDLEDSIQRDSSVLPLFYNSISWLISNDIKIKENSQINLYPLMKDVVIDESFVY